MLLVPLGSQRHQSLLWPYGAVAAPPLSLCNNTIAQGLSPCCSVRKVHGRKHVQPVAVHAATISPAISSSKSCWPYSNNPPGIASASLLAHNAKLRLRLQPCAASAGRSSADDSSSSREASIRGGSRGRSRAGGRGRGTKRTSESSSGSDVGPGSSRALLNDGIDEGSSSSRGGRGSNIRGRGRGSYRGGSSAGSSSGREAIGWGQGAKGSKGLTPKGITDAITACWTVPELLQVINLHIDSMTAYNLPAAISRLSKLQCDIPQPYKECVQRYLQVCAQDTARNVANVVYALCTAPPAITPRFHLEVQQQLVPAFVSKRSTAQPQNISNVLYGMAVSNQQLDVRQLQQLLDAFVGLRLQQAKPQELANTMWAVAKMEQQVQPDQLRQLLDAVAAVLQHAAPQSISNTLWAVATMGQAVPAGQLQQLLGAFVGLLQQAHPQEVANTLWAVATMGQAVPAGQLQQLLGAFVGLLQQANPQEVVNTLWAVATMGQQVPVGQLQQLLGALLSKLHHVNPQDVSNTLLACAKLGFLPQQLLAAPGLAKLLQADTPQGLANAAWACGELGHRDEQLMGALLAEAQQRLVASNRHSSSGFNSQNLCNMCWAVAVLDLQQHAQQVLQLAQACSSTWSGTVPENRQQLWQVRTWLLDFQLAEGQGLQGSLTQQQLEQCRIAWQQQLRMTVKQRHTNFQRSVFAAVQRLPIDWQQQPQMEQLSVGRDGVTPDGALLLDIAGRTADGVLVAVEADGPSHFRQPDGALTGATHYRNRALAIRGYVLVSVPVRRWRELSSTEQRQQYLMRLFEEAGVLQFDQHDMPQQQPDQRAQRPKQLKGSKARASAQALLRQAGLQPRAMSAESAQELPRQRRRRVQVDSSATPEAA